MPRQRRSAVNSVAGKVRNAGDIERILPVPDGLVIDTDAGMVLWRQYTGARAHEHWREFDLLQIGKMVLLELKIRELTVQINDEGHIIDGRLGPQENPLLRAIDVLEKRHLSIVRSLSLGVGKKGPDLNRSGIKAKDKADVEKLKKGSVADLMAV